MDTTHSNNAKGNDMKAKLNTIQTISYLERWTYENANARTYDILFALAHDADFLRAGHAIAKTMTTQNRRIANATFKTFGIAQLRTLHLDLTLLLDLDIWNGCPASVLSLRREYADLLECCTAILNGYKATQVTR